MSNIVKKFTVTQVQYSIVSVEDGAVRVDAQPDAVFRGVLGQKRINRELRKRHGENANIVITKIESGEHRFVMSFEDFVRGASIIEEEHDREETTEATLNEEDISGEGNNDGAGEVAVDGDAD